MNVVDRTSRFSFFSLLPCLLLAACATNPLTGKSNLMLVGRDWDEQVGRTQYAPMRQAQGGDYVADPEVEAYVNEVGSRLAAHSRIGLPYEFNVLNDSVPNAWALPNGKIAVNRGLLTELDNEAELAAVLGHEIVHADARHGAQAQSKAIAGQAGAVVAGVAAGVASDDASVGAIVLAGASVGAQLVNQKYGRDAEREADEYGIRYMQQAGYDPQGAVSLQEKFVKLSASRNPNWLEGLFASHPPSRERVANNRALAAALPAGGEIGEARYKQHLAYLFTKKPAYDAFDRAQASAAKKDYKTARAELDRAIKLEPHEGRFYALYGDIALAQNQPRDAEMAYNTAIREDPEWFYYYLRRGQVREKMGQLTAARVDLHQSLKLLPTAVAHYTLGLVERRSGNRAQAVEHLQTARQAGGEIGEAAGRELAAMGIN